MTQLALARRRLAATDTISPTDRRRHSRRPAAAWRRLTSGTAAPLLLLLLAAGPRPSTAQPAAQPAASSTAAATVAVVAPVGRSGVLNGIVTDTTGVVIPAAEVLVVAYGIAVRTDDKGAFLLPVLPAGDHTLRIRRIGFQPRTRTFSVRDGESWQLLVELVAAPLTLTPVGVTAPVSLGKMASFERRRQGNVGLFVTRDQIAARRAMRLSDIVRTLPGVSIKPSHGGGGNDRMSMRPAPLGGRFDCSPDFYVDGLFVPGLNIDAIPPFDVQGIEVYRGPSDTPVDFRSMNAACGVVAIWTRDPQDKRELP